MGEAFPVVILGGGLTGLSAAFHLAPRRAVVLERESEPGGLARSHAGEGFTFDCTGHLLHLRDPEIVALVERILPGAFARHERRARIFSNGTFTDYPFQANLHGLPIDVVKECLEGFIESEIRRAREGDPDLSRLSFRDWAERTFGRGIAAHFMVPYNTKPWRTDLQEIECGWVSWSIPRPTLKEILDGAFGRTVRGLGYNPTFLYPKKGGIRCLPDALAAAVPDLRLNAAVRAIDAASRTVTLEGGGSFRYERLISTLPLDRLLTMTTGLPEETTAARTRLRAVRVLNLSLGIDRASLPDAHWIYFPEAEYSFYRVGFPAGLGPALAPKGCASLYVERSLLRDEPFDAAGVIDRAVADLRRAGILKAGDRVIYRRITVLDPAYVIYDRHRAERLPSILKTLEDRGIHSAGRFGAWEYSSMESALRAGIDLARRIGAALKTPAAAAGGGS
ncbi:MAG: protoporphyrinogen/coproporphyrinogen oxidase [Candidatus Polarisedimenticolia bacterium]